MRVLQINTVYAKGSTGRIVASIEQVCRDCSLEPLVACGGDIETSESHYKIGGWLSSRIHAHAFTSLFDAQCYGSFFSTMSLLRWIDSKRPDIIHIHNLHGNYINIKLLFDYINSNNIPIVWTFHDCWPITGHCTHFDFIGCEKWKNECHNCPLKKEYPSSLLLDGSRRNYHFKSDLFTSVKRMIIVPVSNWLADNIRSSFLGGYDIKVIYNGINLNVFKPRVNDIRTKFGIGKDKRVLLGVGTAWSELKGLKEFVELSKFPQYQVILVGISKEQKQMLPDSIITVERTDNQDELAEFYSAADVLVNPTYNDSFPTINLEALACGTPVITYRTGGSPETIDLNTGVVVEKGDYETLQKTILMVVDNGKNAYSYHCRKRAEIEYNQSNSYSSYINIYNEILSKE